MKSHGFKMAEKYTQNILSCYIYYDQVIYLEDSCNKIGANEIINNSSISIIYNKKIKLYIRYFDILDNGLYFVIFTNTFNTSYIAKYDPCLKNIKKEKLFEFCFFQEAFINQNLCASINKVVTSNKAVPKFCLVIINEDLEIIKQMQDVDLIKCTNNLFIYANKKNEPDIIQILNWSLEKIKTIKFQDDPGKEFYFRDSFSGSRFENFKVLEDDCYLVNSSKYISIFNENGILLKNFSLESRSYNNICLIQNENLILLKNKNYSDYNPCLFCADFNGKTKK